MDPTRCKELVASALGAFPMCEQFRNMACMLGKHLMDKGFTQVQADALMVEAAGLNFARELDMEKEVREGVDTMGDGPTLKFLAVVRALLDDQDLASGACSSECSSQDMDEPQEECSREDVLPADGVDDGASE